MTFQFKSIAHQLLSAISHLILVPKFQYCLFETSHFKFDSKLPIPHAHQAQDRWSVMGAWAAHPDTPPPSFLCSSLWPFHGLLASVFQPFSVVWIWVGDGLNSLHRCHTLFLKVSGIPQEECPHLRMTLRGSPSHSWGSPGSLLLAVNLIPTSFICEGP